MDTPAVAGISNPASSGSGNPNEVLVNTTTAPVNVVYVYTVTANGCTNPAIYSVSSDGISYAATYQYTYAGSYM